MNADSLEPLLERLCRGDMVGAERLFREYEPYLRQFVRRQLSQRLRAKFDSVDIVQSVWADVLHGYRSGVWHFPDEQHFQAFLVQVTRNRFISTFRKNRLASEKEQPLGNLPSSQLPTGLEPEAPQILEAQELWEQMLALCPPEHQELLQLKRQGMPMEEMVARTGLHAGSIRRIFRKLARKLALGQEPVTPVA
jgi:RNA polymerase sigma-70 factor (ECF subfamily)